MAESNIEIYFFPVKDASQTEYDALNTHTNRIRLERLPDDPPVPRDETIRNLQSIPAFADLRIWAAWNAEKKEIVAIGNIVLLRMEENKRLAQFELSVLPEYRQQGLGRRLLQEIAETAREDHRRLLMTETVDRIPAGETFMKRIGAKKGLETHTNQLRIAELDPVLLNEWLSNGQKNQDRFEIGLWKGAYPEENILAIAELTDLANQQPLGDLEIEDMHMTPEQLRQSEQNLFARGSQRWTIYAVERANGRFSGYTETTWNPNRPEILQQEMTGVFPQYRNRGLGRWLKAAMLDKVLKERPGIKYVRTGNADSNAAMLKINNELGFKPYMADSLWQVELQKVMDYLQPHIP
jgi:GNAT superfamily N-acetyltransferase